MPKVLFLLNYLFSAAQEYLKNVGNQTASGLIVFFIYYGIY